MSRENLSYAICEQQGADQPAHPRSLICPFVVRCLESITPVVAIPKISRLYLASVAEQTRLSLYRLHTAEDRFSHDVAQMFPITQICQKDKDQ